MYNIKVDVKLSPRGQQLLHKDEYTCIVSTQDPFIGKDLQNKKNYVMNIFEHDVMPAGMFDPESLQVTLVSFTIKEGEWMDVEIHLNDFSTIYIPMEVYFDEDSNNGLLFHLRPINGLIYDSFNENLNNSRYTKRSLQCVDKISRYKFSISDMKPINNSATINLIAHPMESRDIYNVKESIKHSQACELMLQKIEMLRENLNNLETRRLKDLACAIDGILDEEYDTFGS